jgi:hypothetical protein
VIGHTRHDNRGTILYAYTILYSGGGEGRARDGKGRAEVVSGEGMAERGSGWAGVVRGEGGTMEGAGMLRDGVRIVKARVGW